MADQAVSINALPLAVQEAVRLDALAWRLHDEGNLAEATRCAERSLAILEVHTGPQPQVKSLRNLAAHYKAEQAYERAETTLIRALDLLERAHGPRHLDCAGVLHNLGDLYKSQKAYSKAGSMYEHALGIRERGLGVMHPDVALSLDQLGDTYCFRGAYEIAKPMFARSLAIRERALGATHPTTAQSLYHLSLVQQELGELDCAERLLIRALVIFEAAQVTPRPDWVACLNDLAMRYRKQGDHDKAALAFARFAEVHDIELQRELVRLPTRQQRARLANLQPLTELVVSLHADMMPASAELLELALTTILRRKGRVASSLAENRVSLLVGTRPELRDTFQQLTDANTQLSTWLRRCVEPRELENYIQEIFTLQSRIDNLEAKLNTASAEIRVEPETVTVTTIRAALPEGGALVEFVRYRRYVPGGTEVWHEPRYAAYVLPRQGPIRCAAIGPADVIDGAIEAMLIAMRECRDEATAVVLRRLDAMLLEPIRGWLTGISHIIVSPDAQLNLVPFEALQDAEGHYVLENWLVSHVGSGRDLLRLRHRRASRSISTILAAPDYGIPRLASEGMFCPLNGSFAEAQQLPTYLARARVLTGAQASKAALAATVGPSVLHIATHGYFARPGFALHMPDTSPSTAGSPTSSSAIDRPMVQRDVICTPAENGHGDAPSAVKPNRTKHVFQPLPTELEYLVDPLDRAALALAGANRESDGVVTAREIASYDWWGTQLVVLSACDTARGAAPAGDSVHGMRSALVQAGTETQVVSLWAVSDSSTPCLMQEFYRELALGTGRAEALRRAKLRFLARSPERIDQPHPIDGNDRLARDRFLVGQKRGGDPLDLDRNVRDVGLHEEHAGRLGFAHPYHWAGFILAGDWTPLSGNVARSREHRETLAGSAKAPAGLPRITLAALAAASDWRPLATDAFRRVGQITTPSHRSWPDLPTGLEFIFTVLMRSDRLGERVEPKAIAKQIQAVQEEIAGLYARGEIQLAPMALFVAMKPDRQIKTWVVGIECQLAAEDIALIESRTGTWRAPAVRGPVTLVYAFARKEPPLKGIPPTPRAWAEAAAKAGKVLMLPDELIAAVWPD
jgi:CHAT domain-containing protein/tetratricopeptide (TPR) repeat protein